MHFQSDAQKQRGAEAQLYTSSGIKKK